MQNNKLNNNNKKNNINLIKKIRNLTNISIKKCKKALEKNNYNLKKSIIFLKKNKIKKNNLPKKGIIINKIKNNIAIMLKLLCETDFTSKNIIFKKFSKKIINFCLKKKIFILKKIKKYFKKKIQYLILKFNENILIDNICFLKGKYINKYLHYNKKIGTILKINTYKNKINKKYIKQICMHITSMNPKYISIKNIPKNILKKNIKKINSNNKKNNIYKINEKFKKNILLEQKFIFNNKIKIKNFLNKKKINIINFYTYKI